MALTGTLADAQLDELATLLQQQKRTGHLTLSFLEGRVGITFRDGAICQVDDERRTANRRIGELLVAGGCILRSDLAGALEAQRASNEPIGALLIDQSKLGEADLHRYLDLQFRESLYPLFEETGGAFEFDGSEQAPRSCAPPPILVDDVLMEAARRFDEMPEVMALVPSPVVRVRRLRETLVVPGGSPLADAISERESRVFLAIEGRTMVADLVGKTCLSTFDVMKACALLLEAGLIELTDPVVAGSGGRLGSSTALGLRESAWQRRPGVTRPVLHVALSLVLSLTVLAVVINIFMARVWSSAAEGSRPVSALDSPLRTMRTEAHLRRLAGLVEAYRADNGGYPPTLETLVEAGQLTPRDLRWPFYAETYYYRPTVEGFVLLPPQR